MKQVLQKLYERVRAIYKENPVRVYTYLAGLALAAGLPVAVAGVPVELAIAIGLALAFGGELPRQQVTPVAKHEKQVQDAVEAGVTPKKRKPAAKRKR